MKCNVLSDIFWFEVKDELSLHYASIVDEDRRMANLWNVSNVSRIGDYGLYFLDDFLRHRFDFFPI